MNLIFTPSLEQRVLASIAITLWSQDDIRDLMSQSPLHILHANWQEIEKSVIEKSFKLRLPEILKKKLLSFIVRVGFQILLWVDLHHCRYNFVTELPATFVWTSLGTINNIKTAELLVKSGTLDHDVSFALASMYCLVNEVIHCWYMFDICISLVRPRLFMLCFVLYWIAYMHERNRQLLLKYSHIRDSYIPYESFITDATINGNEAATRYLFNKQIQHYDIEISAKVLALELYYLENIMSLQRYSDTMLFLLSKMNVTQQANVIRNYTYAFLKCLLVWPWHRLFLKMSKDNWNSLSEDEYNNLLHFMVVLMRYEHNIHKLFEEFWQQTPEMYKQFIIDQGNFVYLLIDLYKSDDEKNVKLILKDSSISIKENILKIRSKPIFIYLISSKMWDSIEFLIKECFSSLEDLIRFRDLFKDRVQTLHSKNNFCNGDCLKFEFIQECQWDKFFQIVNDYTFRYNKKNTIDDNTSSKKRWCKDIEE